jgi:hypothetical protein
MYKSVLLSRGKYKLLSSEGTHCNVNATVPFTYISFHHRLFIFVTIINSDGS